MGVLEKIKEIEGKLNPLNSTLFPGVISFIRGDAEDAEE